MIHILLVEDDPAITENLRAFLNGEGFEVSAVCGQTDALKLIESEAVDLVLLDVMLKDGNGFSICSAIKSTVNIPVIFLTASGDEFSTVTGFNVGADDYIAKPFRPHELVSRIKNVLRRCGSATSVTSVGNIRIDTLKGTAQKNGNDVFLSALEYRLLLVFLNNRNVILSREKLLNEIWDIAGDFVNNNTLTVYIKRLREKIEDDPQNPTIIKTIRGLGYRMD